MSREEKFQKPNNKSFIDQAFSIKMAGYWPCNFFASLWTSTLSRSINMQKKKNLATWSITHIQCSSDISEPKYTRNTRQPNTRIRVYIYANARMHIRVYAYTVYARMPH